jgi:hypothetical protein
MEVTQLFQLKWLIKMTTSDHQQQLFIYRNRNKNLVRKAMNNLDWEANNNSSDLANQNKYSMEQLKAMQLVARMKEAADNVGAGFVGGFITPSGQRFMMSNVDADDVQNQAIMAQLDAIHHATEASQTSDDSLSFFDAFQNNLRIVETEDGVQIIIEATDE